MKTAILSVHSDPNYGSMLQAYALSAALDKLGCDNEYINYIPYKRKNPIISFCKRLIRALLEFFHLIPKTKSEYSYWNSKEFRKQRLLFNEFHKKYIKSSSEFYFQDTISEANTIYKKFIIGSDQTWSPLLSATPYSISFLPFVNDKNKKCAYAPSIGTTHIDKDYLEILKFSLSDFAYLSCREKSNALLLTSYLGRTVQYVLDPTLLLKQEEWLHISEPINMPTEYILCYILGTKKCIYEYASRLARMKHLPLYIIVTRPEYHHYPNALKDVSVGQFLTLIHNAKYVVTDSFHGSLFSINLGTNFYAFAKREQSYGMNDNDRIGDFLEVIGLSDRLKNDNDFSINPDIDFQSIYEIIDSLRETSYNYLRKVI